MTSLPFVPDDPEWLPHRHVETEASIRYAWIPRSERTIVPFLTDECLGEPRVTHSVSLEETLAALPNPQLCWIFHSAFCGSTMLSHSFDLPGVCSSLSEPVLLNDVVGFRRRGADPREVARLADASLRALGRTYPGESHVVIKPSNVVNPLAALCLALQPGARAIFLYAPLETFLVSVARKGLACRLWVRELLAGYLRENFIHLGFPAEEYFRQTDLQVAAVGWLAQHGYFAQLARQLGPERIQLVDADRLMARPGQAVLGIARHFGLDLAAPEADEIANGRAFKRHSKSGEAYSADARRADYASARAAYGEEIDKVVAWAGEVANSAGIAMDGHGLLDQLG